VTDKGNEPFSETKCTECITYPVTYRRTRSIGFFTIGLQLMRSSSVNYQCVNAYRHNVYWQRTVSSQSPSFCRTNDLQ